MSLQRAINYETRQHVQMELQKKKEKRTSLKIIKLTL